MGMLFWVGDGCRDGRPKVYGLGCRCSHMPQVCAESRRQLAQAVVIAVGYGTTCSDNSVVVAALLKAFSEVPGEVLAM